MSVFPQYQDGANNRMISLRKKGRHSPPAIQKQIKTHKLKKKPQQIKIEIEIEIEMEIEIEIEIEILKQATTFLMSYSLKNSR
ncbi:hypothetical protein [Escherichia albertii]|uniref:hypothetical protein n=1 Tax=Escherichia albertii TaxID=208962 RepID=UPI001300C868|nr:hypothetical protein [Escherichia albertii]